MLGGERQQFIGVGQQQFRLQPNEPASHPCTPQRVDQCRGMRTVGAPRPAPRHCASMPDRGIRGTRAARRNVSAGAPAHRSAAAPSGKALGGQVRQYVRADPVRAERIRVLFQPETAEPARDVQFGRPGTLPSETYRKAPACTISRRFCSRAGRHGRPRSKVVVFTSRQKIGERPAAKLSFRGC
jgi:hypothetical protein